MHHFERSQSKVTFLPSFASSTKIDAYRVSSAQENHGNALGPDDQLSSVLDAMDLSRDRRHFSP
jgi:hypothetical protein